MRELSRPPADRVGRAHRSTTMARGRMPEHQERAWDNTMRPFDPDNPSQPEDLPEHQERVWRTTMQPFGYSETDDDRFATPRSRAPSPPSTTPAATSDSADAVPSGHPDPARQPGTSSPAQRSGVTPRSVAFTSHEWTVDDTIEVYLVGKSRSKEVKWSSLPEAAKQLFR